jgi:hypothetical protein
MGGLLGHSAAGAVSQENLQQIGGILHPSK